MRLRLPTDFLILEALDKHGRNVATNLEHHTGKSKNNINNRLPYLESYGLVNKVGPAKRSGLYEITDLGRIALKCQDKYSHDKAAEFGQLIREVHNTVNRENIDIDNLENKINEDELADLMENNVRGEE